MPHKGYRIHCAENSDSPVEGHADVLCVICPGLCSCYRQMLSLLRANDDKALSALLGELMSVRSRVCPFPGHSLLIMARKHKTDPRTARQGSAEPNGKMR